YSGISFVQTSILNGQRVWNAQPLGGSTGLGISPSKTVSSLSNSGSGTGTAESNACVYGCNGSWYNFSASDISTIFPKYMTPIRSLIFRTTPKSLAIKM